VIWTMQHAGAVPAIDLVDDTFVVAPTDRLAELVADPLRWRRWWPDLRLTRTRDRGLKGQQWRVDGPLVGTAEIWLEPWQDGVIVHFYLRCDLAHVPQGAPERADRERRRRAQEWKRAVHGLKDQLELGRQPGTARVRTDAERADDTSGGTDTSDGT
jgi:hypothetical protein